MGGEIDLAQIALAFDQDGHYHTLGHRQRQSLCVGGELERTLKSVWRLWRNHETINAPWSAAALRIDHTNNDGSHLGGDGVLQHRIEGSRRVLRTGKRIAFLVTHHQSRI